MMRRWASWLAALLLIAWFAPSAALAVAPVEYSDKAFAAAQARGQTIVVETYASWCLPCRIQAPIIDRLRAREPLRRIVLFRIGEETPKAIWRRFRLNGFGMIVVFKGDREMARGTPTNEAAVADLLHRGL